MVMPYMYEDGPRTETKISHRVGDLHIEGGLNLQETCKGDVMEMRKGRALQKGLQI